MAAHVGVAAVFPLGSDPSTSGAASRGASPGREGFIRALLARDRQAFGALVEHDHRRLLRLAMGLVGDPVEAEDVVQEAFVRAWRGLGALRLGDVSPAAQGTVPRSLMNWLTKITVNVARDHWRAKGRQVPKAPTGDGGELLEGQAISPDPDPHAAALGQEFLAAAGAAIQCLPGALRETFVLRVLEGESYGVIAEATGVRPATVRSRMVEARRRLKAILGEEQ